MNIVILYIKGIARKLMLYSTEPNESEVMFVKVYLHREINTRMCIVCRDAFWTVGKSLVCRKMSCYTLNRGYIEEKKQHG